MAIPTVPNDIKYAVNQRIRACLDMAAKQGVRVALPTVRYDIRGTNGGTANWAKNELRFNPLFLLENTTRFIHQTVGHEVAHLVARRKHSPNDIAPHGAEWQAVMRSFELAPDRCHNYDTSSSPKDTVAYNCSCREHQLSPRQHAKMTFARYRCARCRSYLVRVANLPTFTNQKTTQVASPFRPEPIPLTRPEAQVPLPPLGPHAMRPPTEAMLAYAKRISQQWGVLLPGDALHSFDACGAYIARYKQASVPTAMAPTEKQLLLAQTFTNITKNLPPTETLRDKSRMSQWLGEQSELAKRMQR